MVPRRPARDDADGKEATVVLQFDEETSRQLVAA